MSYNETANHRKKLPIILGIIAILLAILLLAAWILFRDELKIMGSIKSLSPDQPAYYMEIESDYHFEEFLESGGASSDKEVSTFLTKCMSKGFYSVDVTESGPACSLISALNEDGTHVWGRNYDWDHSLPIIVKCVPDEGYASIATCDFQNITGDPDLAPDNFADKMLAIASLYVPMDGINEAGLCVGDLEVNEGGMLDVDTDKPDLTITTATRLILNKAATVEEALALLDRYDIHASGGISHHLAVSDKSGASVVLEFVGGKTVVVDSPYVTNFNLANNDISAGGESSQRRYEILKAAYEENSGVLSLQQVRDSMQKVSQTEGEWTTQWSIVYDQSIGQASYFFNGNFDKEYRFSPAR